MSEAAEIVQADAALRSPGRFTGTWAICKREFASYFLTPVGYAVVGIFVLLAGCAFSLTFIFFARISESPAAYGYTSVPDFEELCLSPFLVFCGSLLMFLSPMITMRLFAEERHRGTIELLFTHPLSDAEIVFGKYLAALGMTCFGMLFIAVDLAIIWYFVDIEFPVLVLGLLSVFLMGAACIAFGMFLSAVTKNQITAATLSFGGFLFSYTIGSLSEDLPKRMSLFETWPPALAKVANGSYGVLRTFLIELRIDAHAEDMAQGILEPNDIAYYVLVTAFFIFLTFRALESRHWRG